MRTRVSERCRSQLSGVPGEESDGILSEASADNGDRGARSHRADRLGDAGGSRPRAGLVDIRKQNGQAAIDGTADHVAGTDDRTDRAHHLDRVAANADERERLG
jgi:hypothetical protein